jgi:hypothetical protein
MSKLNTVDFSRLAGIDHGWVSRLVKQRRLCRVDSLLDTDHVANSVYLQIRYVEIQIAAEMGKASPGWVLLSVNDGGKKVPIASWVDIDFPKSIRLCRFRYYTLNDDDETATEKETGRILQLVFERDE